MLKNTFTLIAGLLSANLSHAATEWTQVDCGGLNETLQVSRPFEAGTVSLNFAQYLTMILGDKAVHGWPEGRPMRSSLYIGADVQSVEPLQFPGAAAAYVVTITSKNHYPDTKVVCTFTAVREE